MLGLPFGAQSGQIDVDPFESELLLLLLERLEQLLLLAVALLALELLRRDRLAGARLRVGIVRRPAGALLRVLLLSPLGAPVLEPNLINKT